MFKFEPTLRRAPSLASFAGFRRLGSARPLEIWSGEQHWLSSSIVALALLGGSVLRSDLAMARLKLGAAAAAVLLSVAAAAVDDDLVTHLPGYVHPDGSPKPLPTRHCEPLHPKTVKCGPIQCRSYFTLCALPQWILPRRDCRTLPS